MHIALYNVNAMTPEGEELELALNLAPNQAAQLINRLSHEDGDELTSIWARPNFWVHLNRGEGRRSYLRRIGFSASASA